MGESGSCSWSCWRTHLSRTLCGAVIFMRHVFICIYYCFAYNLLAGGKFSARNENLLTALPLSLSLCVCVPVFVCLFASVISVSACLEFLLLLAWVWWVQSEESLVAARLWLVCVVFAFALNNFFLLKSTHTYTRNWLSHCIWVCLIATARKQSKLVEFHVWFPYIF